MESPFYDGDGVGSGSGIYKLYLQTILDTRDKTYKHIVLLNTMPKGPLSKMVKHMSLPQLSAFQSSISQTECVYALSKYPIHGSGVLEYMTSDDIPAIMGYLEKNNYKIYPTRKNVNIFDPSTILLFSYQINI